MLFSLLICAESLFSHEGDSFAAWKEFSTGKDSSLLISWLKKNARCIITGHRFSEKPGVEIPQFYGRYGIFITLKNSKGVRGCYGSFYPHTPDARMLLSDYLEGALTRDPRHEPVDISELDATDIILTVASHPVPVEDIYSDEDLFRERYNDKNSGQKHYLCARRDKEYRLYSEYAAECT